MAQDQRETYGRGRAGRGRARLRAVACLSGVSLERGVPAGEIHDYIQEIDNVVWVDVQDPGPAELAMLIDEFGLHPLALEDAAHGRRRPKVDEFKGYLLLVTQAAIPGAGRRGAADRRGGSVHRPQLSWSPSTGAASPGSRIRVGALDARRADAPRGRRLPHLRGARRHHRLLSPRSSAASRTRSTRPNSPCLPGRMRRA